MTKTEISKSSIGCSVSTKDQQTEDELHKKMSTIFTYKANKNLDAFLKMIQNINDLFNEEFEYTNVPNRNPDLKIY